MSTMENIKFLFKGVEIDERTQDYIKKRLSGLDKYMDNINLAEVEVDMDKKGKFRVEVMLFTPKNMFRADETTDSVEGSIDLVVDEIQNQMTHMKDKLRTLKKEGGRDLKKKMVGGEE